jgi:hypothetical protein
MSAAPVCRGTPISWLRLEQHHAGELAADERATVTEHLSGCEACAACLTTIETDAAVTLPPLVVRPRPARVSVLRRAAPAVVGLAIAAAVLFALGRRPRVEPTREVDPLAARTKGGGVAFVLVRDDEVTIAEAGGAYHDGDRWKALVTCPGGMRAAWDMVVFERGEAAFPLAPTADLACGNAVPLPGAFRTTGHEPMAVCVVWSEAGTIDRAALRGASPETLPHASCKTLAPAW